MSYIGKTPTPAPLTSSDITDGIIITDKLAANAVVTSKITDGTITNADISSTVITGQSAITGVANDDLVLISDTSGSAALKKMTVANLVANAGGGKIGQVVSTHKTDATSTTSSSYEDISGMSVAITPSATSSKILVLYRLTLSNGTADRNDSVRLLRGSTAIIDPSDFYRIGSNTYVYNASGNFLDSPSSSSELTYKFQWLVEASGHTGYLNRRGQNSTIRGHSTITVMEVLA